MAGVSHSAFVRIASGGVHVLCGIKAPGQCCLVGNQVVYENGKRPRAAGWSLFRLTFLRPVGLPVGRLSALQTHMPTLTPVPALLVPLNLETGPHTPHSHSASPQLDLWTAVSGGPPDTPKH